MNKLDSLKKLGFHVTWNLIGIGLYGLMGIPVLLTNNEVCEYLDCSLVQINDQTDSIISLLCAKDESRFDLLFKERMEQDRSDITVQKSKWVVYLLKDLLDHSDSDYMQGLLNLLEFWTSMKDVRDCPHIFPKKDGIIPVDQYFTESTYKMLIEINRDWIHNETDRIIRLERNCTFGL